MNNTDIVIIGAGPYGMVDIHLTNSTTATVTFTAQPGFTFTEMGLNVAASNFSATLLGKKLKLYPLLPYPRSLPPNPYSYG